MQNWFVYFLRCADDSLYAGITTDLDRRLAEHNGGVCAAKYTRARRPVELVYFETLPDRAAAAKREFELRRMTKGEKEGLVAGGRSLAPSG